MKSGQAKAETAKTEAARTAAAKTAAAKTAASRAATAKSASKTAAAKATAARTAAARTTAAKSAATKAAAAKAAAEAEVAAEAVEADTSGVAANNDPSEQATVLEASATNTASRKPAVARQTPKKTTQRTAKPRVTKPTTRPKPVVAADAAAPTGEAIASPTGDVELPAEDAVAEDALFADLLAVDSADAESATEPAEPEHAPVDEAADPESDATAEAAPDAAAAVAAAVEDAPVEDSAAPASAAHAVVLRGLVKDFGDQRAVDGIDLTVPAGSFYGIVGPNGAGKTTTLSILAGLLRATSGQVVVCGIDQATDPLSTKRVMGVLPDRLRTFDRLTGRQLLHYYGLLRGLTAEVIEKRTADLARAFDLADALNRVVSDYSAGMTKKIMLAGAMIHSPRVLVLDEPFEAVDPVSSAVILDILRAYVAHGGTVILSSHGMDLVERVCSRVAIIVGGEVLAEGTIDEVRAGQTLESRFVELSGGVGEVEGLEWLHAFSD